MIRIKKGWLTATLCLCFFVISCATKISNTFFFNHHKIVNLKIENYEETPDTFVDSWSSHTLPLDCISIFEKKYLQEPISYNVIDFFIEDNLLLILLKNNLLISNYKDCMSLLLSKNYLADISFDKGYIALKRKKDNSLSLYALPACAEIIYPEKVYAPFNFTLLHPYYVIYDDSTIYVYKISNGLLYFSIHIKNNIKHAFVTHNKLAIIDKKNNIIFLNIKTKKYINTITLKKYILDVKSTKDKIYFISKDNTFNIINLVDKNGKLVLEEDFNINISPYKNCYLANHSPALICDNKLITTKRIIDLYDIHIPTTSKFDILNNNILLYTDHNTLYKMYIDKLRFVKTITFNKLPIVACKNGKFLFFKDLDGLEKAMSIDNTTIINLEKTPNNCENNIPLTDGSFKVNGKAIKYANLVKIDNGTKLYKRVIDNKTYFFSSK